MKFSDNLNISKTLDLNENLTFGVEIEFERVSLSNVEKKLSISKKNNLLSDAWILKQDDSLKKYKDTFGIGGELVSPILTDKIDSYKEIRNACHIVRELDGIANEECGAHIHIGSNLFNEDIKKYIRLMKLWSIYENEIIKFSLGENVYKRNMQDHYAAPCKNIFLNLDDKMTYYEFIRRYANDKKRAISFFYLNSYKPFHTIEIRCPSGTLDEKIWKNNINFFAKIIMACLDENKDWDFIDKKYNERLLFEDKVNDLINFVFDNDQDKNNFMIQYKKDSKVLVR